MSETITVNGEPVPGAGRTLHELIEARGLDPDRPGLAVAVNATVAPRARWRELRLAPGDRVEIVHPKAGG